MFVLFMFGHEVLEECTLPQETKAVCVSQAVASVSQQYPDLIFTPNQDVMAKHLIHQFPFSVHMAHLQYLAVP